LEKEIPGWKDLTQTGVDRRLILMKTFILLSISLIFSLKSTSQVIINDSFYFSKARELLFALNNEKFDKAVTLFDESVSNEVNAAVLKSTWSQLFSKVGNIKSTGKPRIEKTDSITIVYIPCVFDDATLDMKIPFSDKNKILGFFFVAHPDAGDYRLPSYADTSAIKELDISVVTGKFKMPGKYVYPKNAKGKIPVVVLVHGSGPNDMDETIEANKPFKDLAYALAKQGIGVVRYDKRTKIYPNQMYGQTNFTLEQETIIDAISAVKLSRKLPDADSNRIYIAGHSLGAMVAPLIAQQAGKLVAGIILMASPARPLEDMILEQTEYLDSLIPSDKNKMAIETLKNQAYIVSTGNFSPKTPSTELPLGLTANYWLFLHNYHQTETAKKLKIPILILQGGRDYQVSMTDFKLWEKVLGKSKNVIFHSYPTLNHLFMEGEGKSTPAEYETSGHVAEYVIDDIVNWIKSIR
jgi:dienelactone hydrolase